ncbi:MAG: serine hydrolase [Chloroflexi bacterium]|nr:serine hydrolase [Chloroflexota bacterium]
MTTVAAPLPRSTPEAQGIPSSAITAFLEAAEQDECGLHSFMLLRHGHVVAEGWWSPYAPDAPHMLFSLSKSFTSTAVGMAVAEGRLSVDDPVLAFFPAEAPRKPSENLAAIRIRHLLSMSTGHDHDTTEHLYKRRDGDWPRAFLARPVAHAPGTHFLYNTGATYMLSAIVQRVTGMTLLNYLRPRLLAPLGIEGATWETCPRGVNTGGFGLSIKTEDIARFGQLYLQRGVWGGQHLLPETWVMAEASARQASNGTNAESDWEQGYGYQFWLCRHGAYRADGAFGQFCVILPEQDAVVAITAGTPNMQAVLNLIWTHLLPALAPAPRAEDVAAQLSMPDATPRLMKTAEAAPTPPERRAWEPDPLFSGQEALARKLSSLALSPVQGQPSSSVAPKVSGQRYHFTGKRAPLRAISFDFGRDEDVCTVQDDRGEHRVICGRGAWATGITTWDLTHPHPTAHNGRLPVAASGAWTAEDTYELRLYFTETPFCSTIVCKFVADKVKLKFRVNVSFGPTEFPQLTGQIGEAS